MTQSRLVGTVGDGKSSEGNHKHLKTAVPNFDNSDLIKIYSKTVLWVGFKIWCCVLGILKLWNKDGCFGYCIWYIRRMSCALILWIILIDAVLLRCFGLYGSQDQKEGVTWSLGIWMWLRTVLYGLAAQTQSLWLVSLNQLQKRDLELGLVIVLEMKENQWCRTYVNGFMGISCRRYTGFVPINFVSWCHGLEIEICIKMDTLIREKAWHFLNYFHIMHGKLCIPFGGESMRFRSLYYGYGFLFVKHFGECLLR